jgi:hypothetical protein
MPHPFDRPNGATSFDGWSFSLLWQFRISSLGIGALCSSFAGCMRCAALLRPPFALWLSSEQHTIEEVVVIGQQKRVNRESRGDVGVVDFERIVAVLCSPPVARLEV